MTGILLKGLLAFSRTHQLQGGLHTIFKMHPAICTGHGRHTVAPCDREIGAPLEACIAAYMTVHNPQSGGELHCHALVPFLLPLLVSAAPCPTDAGLCK